MIKQLKERGTAYDRRRARRFHVTWPVVLRGCDSQGASFEESTELANISSGGAFVYCVRELDLGATVDVRIRVPFGSASWISYSAEVVRTDPRPALQALAVRFLNSRPLFN